MVAAAGISETELGMIELIDTIQLIAGCSMRASSVPEEEFQMTADASEGQSSYERIPYVIRYQERAGFKDTYAGELGTVILKAHLLRPRNQASDSVMVFMHPIGGGEYLPLPSALAAAGHHVIWCNSRYPGVDYALIMEKVAIDLGACISDARHRLG